jgi:hypothetical protein
MEWIAKSLEHKRLQAVRIGTGESPEKCVPGLSVNALVCFSNTPQLCFSAPHSCLIQSLNSSPPSVAISIHHSVSQHTRRPILAQIPSLLVSKVQGQYEHLMRRKRIALLIPIGAFRIPLSFLVCPVQQPSILGYEMVWKAGTPAVTWTHRQAVL